jgi:zinc transporter 1/2/3
MHFFYNVAAVMASVMLPLLVSAHGDHSIKDKSECGLIEESVYVYDMPWHIASFFIILVASILGSVFPILSVRVPFLRENSKAIDIIHSFGYGVVISTAFVHMIPHANANLNSPCLDTGYSGLPMVICLASMFMMQLFETEIMVFFSKQIAATSNTEKAIGLEDSTTAANLQTDLLSSVPMHGHHQGHSHHGHSHGVAMFLDDASRMRKKVSVFIFEIGVAVHSVIVGIELGVATGKEFMPLLLAVAFHQFFEGIAVGASAMTAMTSIKSLLLTALAYSLSTPLGIFIGIIISSTYSPTSSTALWVQGTFDAMAGGILIYTGIVELLNNQYTANAEFHNKPGSARALNYAFLYLGSAAMSIVGLWA